MIMLSSYLLTAAPADQPREPRAGFGINHHVLPFHLLLGILGVPQLLRHLGQVPHLIGHGDLSNFAVGVDLRQMFPQDFFGCLLGNVFDHQGPGLCQAGIFELEILGELLHEEVGGRDQEKGEDCVDVEVGGPE